MTDYEAFVHELIGYIFKVQDKDDDNLSAEIVCRKLYKYGLIKRDDHKWRMKYRPRYVWPARIRKTEPQRGCDADCNEDCIECAKETELWKAEQTEPQTCSTCKWSQTVCRLGDNPPCHSYEPKYEPQTEYERASEQREHDILYEPTYSLDDGSM